MCSTIVLSYASDIDAAIAARVAVASDKSDLKRFFTVHDIKTDVRAIVGRQVNVLHSEVRDYVHGKQFDIFNEGYTRQSIPTPSGDALLYLPQGDDPQAYIDAINGGVVGTGNTTLPSPNSPTALPSPNNPPAATPRPTPSISVTGSNFGTALSVGVALAAASTASPSVKNQTIDKEGRLPIYADQLDSIGCKAGKPALIYITGKSIKITSGANKAPTPAPYATYTVNADGRIRITGKVLDRHLPSVNRTYKVRTDGQSIVIEA